MSKKPEKDKNQHIQVYVRCRPQNASERKANSQIVVEAIQETKEIVVKDRLCDKDYSKKFTFDRVFGPENTQLDVYKTVASTCIEEVLMGYNCTVFAYGQTGTGKTYTMQGRKSSERYTWEEDPESGIVPRTLSHLFDELKSRFGEYTIRVSFLEIYNEELFDLLGSMTDGNKLRLFDDITRKGSVVIQGLSELTVHNKEEVYHIMELGANRRRTASTLMNTDSSRSHTVFSITVHIREYNVGKEEFLKTGKLNLVDLAGSECVGRSGAVDRRAREAGSINQSLLTLGRVITALIERTPHIPYRESKLTRLLQDSLGGRTKTSIIATVSPAQCNIEETLSTLDYAHRAKNITNKPEINQKMTKKMLIREYTEEIRKLRADLTALRDTHGIYLDQENYNTMQEKLKFQIEICVDKESLIQSLEAEMEKTKLLFSDAQKERNQISDELEINVAKLDDMSKVLDITCKKATVVTSERDEQVHLVNRRVEGEKVLSEQAHKILNVAEKSTSDVDALHKKLLRKKLVEQRNEKVSEDFQTELRKNLADIVQYVDISFAQQERRRDDVMAFIDSSKAAFKAQSQDVDQALATFLSFYKESITTQNEKLTMTAEEMRKWSDDFLSKSSQHKISKINREARYLARKHSPLYVQLEAMLNKEQAMMLEFQRDIETKLREQLKEVDIFRSTATNAITELRSKAHDFSAGQIPKLAQCQDVVGKVSDAEKNIYQMISGLFDGVHKFMEFATSKQQEVHKQVQAAGANISQLSKQANVVHDDAKQFRVAVESSVQSLHSNVEAFYENSATNICHSRAAASKWASTGKKVKKAMDESVSALSKDIASHSSDTKKAFKVHDQLVFESIENLPCSQGFSEENRELHDLGLAVSQTVELHGKILRKQQAEKEKEIATKQTLLQAENKCIGFFLANVKDNSRQKKVEVEKLLSERLARDLPTGQTPRRQEHSYPRELVAMSPHEKILEEFRLKKKMEAAEKLLLPDEYNGNKLDINDLALCSATSDGHSTDSSESSVKKDKDWKVPKSIPKPKKKRAGK